MQMTYFRITSPSLCVNGIRLGPGLKPT